MCLLVYIDAFSTAQALQRQTLELFKVLFLTSSAGRISWTQNTNIQDVLGIPTWYVIVYIKAVPYLKRLVPNPSLRRPRFNPRLVYVRFVADIMSVKEFFF